MGTIVIGCIVLVIMAVFIVGAVFAYKSYKTPSNKARVDQWQRHGNDTYETTRGKSGGDKKQSFSLIFHLTLSFISWFDNFPTPNSELTFYQFKWLVVYYLLTSFIIKKSLWNKSGKFGIRDWEFKIENSWNHEVSSQYKWKHILNDECSLYFYTYNPRNKVEFVNWSIKLHSCLIAWTQQNNQTSILKISETK